MKNKNDFFDRMQEAIAKITVDTDEKTDTYNESPDSPENPDQKTKSKNKKSPMNIVTDINLGKLEEDSFVESKKNKITSNISELEKSWKMNKASDSPEETVQESIEMSKASIKSIVKHANSLMMGLNETNQSCLSEGWVASKITIIEDYLRTIHDYVMYYEEEEQEEEPEQEMQD